MSLLTEIQSAATDPSYSVADLLRRFQILAFRLRSEDVRAWVVHELNGYPDDAVLPVYRTGYSGHVKAHLFGPAGAQIRNSSVPLSTIPEAFLPWRDFEFREGVAALQDLFSTATSEGVNLMRPFPVEAHVEMSFVRGYSVMQMWAEISPSVVAGVLDQIRNRALEFSLELERDYPEAGETTGADRQPSADAVGSMFTTVILGGSVNLAQAGRDASLVATENVREGDVEALTRSLTALGVAPEDVQLLLDAIKDDADAVGAVPGPRTESWIGRVVARAASSGLRVGEASTAGLIAAVVAKFLGVG